MINTHCPLGRADESHFGDSMLGDSREGGKRRRRHRIGSKLPFLANASKTECAVFALGRQDDHELSKHLKERPWATYRKSLSRTKQILLSEKRERT